MEELRYDHRGAKGVTRAQLRTAAWVSPAHNVYMRREAGDGLRQRCLAIQLVLPSHAVFTHLTSAGLREWWLPDLAWDHLIACTDAGDPHHDRRGVYVRRCAIPPEHRDVLDGVRVASAPRTIVELAEHLSLIDLVVTIDCALFTKACSLAELVAAVVPRRRGVRVLRRALGLCDGRSESRYETILRLVHQLSGITQVEPQYVATDPAGGFLARADLRLGRTQRLVEYDGAEHLAPARQLRDLKRDKGLRRWSWDRYGYVSPEIHGQAQHMIVRDAEDALGLRHDPTRVLAWLYEYRQSSLTAFGRAALLGRLERFVRTASPRAVTGVIAAGRRT